MQNLKHVVDLEKEHYNNWVANLLALSSRHSTIISLIMFSKKVQKTAWRNARMKAIVHTDIKKTLMNTSEEKVNT